MRESVYKFLRKTRGNLYANMYRKAMFLNGAIRIVLLSLVFTITYLIGQEPKSRYALKKWKGIIRWTLGIEKWAR